MEYEEIENYLYTDEKIMEFTPEGIETSPLCIGRMDGEIADCFLVLIPRDKTKQVKWKIYGKRNNDGKVSSKIEEIYEEIEEAQEDTVDESYCIGYMELYSRVRKFAFHEQITEMQKKELGKFMKYWEMAVDQKERSILQKEFPEFFQWAQKIQKEEALPDEKN